MSIRLVCCGCAIRSGSEARPTCPMPGARAEKRLLECELELRWPFVLVRSPDVVFCKIYGKVWTTWFPWLELGRKGIQDLGRPKGVRPGLNQNGLCYQVWLAACGSGL